MGIQEDADRVTDEINRELDQWLATPDPPPRRYRGVTVWEAGVIGFVAAVVANSMILFALWLLYA